MPDPVPQSDDQLLLAVTAAAIKNLDKVCASGMLRSWAISLLGSEWGSFSPETMRVFITDVLTDIFRLAADGKLIPKPNPGP